MRKVTLFLLFASRGLAVCAVLAGLGAGFLQATFGAASSALTPAPLERTISLSSARPRCG